MPLASLSPQGMPLRILPLNSLFFGACYCIEKLVINKLVTIKLAIEELAFEELVTVELKFKLTPMIRMSLLEAAAIMHRSDSLWTSYLHMCPTLF